MNNNENVQKNECSCNTENGKKIVEMLETERKRIVSELHDTSFSILQLHSFFCTFSSMLIYHLIEHMFFFLNIPLYLSYRNNNIV